MSAWSKPCPISARRSEKCKSVKNTLREAKEKEVEPVALSSKQKKELAKQRKENAKQAQKYHKEQERAKKSSEKKKKNARAQTSGRTGIPSEIVV